MTIIPKMITVRLPRMFTTLARAWAAASDEDERELWQAAIEGAVQEWYLGLERPVCDALHFGLEISIQSVREGSPRIRQELAAHIMTNPKPTIPLLTTSRYSFYMTPL